jgi:adenine-specific DNA-methyltransferase
LDGEVKMDYIGSKEKINKWLFSIILKDIDPDGLTFMDACAGSGAVSRYAAEHHSKSIFSSRKKGFDKIISNDMMTFPSHIVRAAISTPTDQYKEAVNLIDTLNNLLGKEGFFYRNYSEDAGRLYFSNINAKKIDAIRQSIKTIDDIYVKSYLLYCLLEAVSAVSNTTGVQAAFLKQLKDRASKDLILKPMPTLCQYQLTKTFNSDILKLLKSSSFRNKYREDIIYIDPPYNERQYGPNYHLYETLVRYDDPEIHGKTGLRNWKNESKSPFCSKKFCLDFTKQIVENTRAKYVFISYSSDGLLHKKEFLDAFAPYSIELFEIDQKRYKSDTDPNRKYDETKLKEYLFKITK